MTERDALLNELAQRLRPMAQGIAWFDALGAEEHSEKLLILPSCTITASRRAPSPKTERGASAAPEGIPAPGRAPRDRRRTTSRAILFRRVRSLVAPAVRRWLNPPRRRHLHRARLLYRARTWPAGRTE